eukprot:gb/GECG01014327.1/.p1 GENE.gb/GECG01014327.1/~~gb/GECG01014327.1/.p1  ORF type:complete len:1227 (+),score=148.96 gb/GECG01014327.1/:1-3681(+)
MNRFQYRKVAEGMAENASKETEEEAREVLRHVLNERRPGRLESRRKRLRYDRDEGCLYRFYFNKWRKLVPKEDWNDVLRETVGARVTSPSSILTTLRNKGLDCSDSLGISEEARIMFAKHGDTNGPRCNQRQCSESTYSPPDGTVHVSASTGEAADTEGTRIVPRTVDDILEEYTEDGYKKLYVEPEELEVLLEKLGRHLGGCLKLEPGGPEHIKYYRCSLQHRNAASTRQLQLEQYKEVDPVCESNEDVLCHVRLRVHLPREEGDSASVEVMEDSHNHEVPRELLPGEEGLFSFMRTVRGSPYGALPLSKRVEEAVKMFFGLPIPPAQLADIVLNTIGESYILPDRKLPSSFACRIFLERASSIIEHDKVQDKSGTTLPNSIGIVREIPTAEECKNLVERNYCRQGNIRSKYAVEIKQSSLGDLYDAYSCVDGYEIAWPHENYGYDRIFQLKNPAQSFFIEKEEDQVQTVMIDSTGLCGNSLFPIMGIPTRQPRGVSLSHVFFRGSGRKKAALEEMWRQFFSWYPRLPVKKLLSDIDTAQINSFLTVVLEHKVQYLEQLSFSNQSLQNEIDHVIWEIRHLCFPGSISPRIVVGNLRGLRQKYASELGDAYDALDVEVQICLYHLFKAWNQNLRPMLKRAIASRTEAENEPTPQGEPPEEAPATEETATGDNAENWSENQSSGSECSTDTDHAEDDSDETESESHSSDCDSDGSDSSFEIEEPDEDRIPHRDLTNLHTLMGTLISIISCETLEAAKAVWGRIQQTLRNQLTEAEEIIRYLQDNFFTDEQLEILVLALAPTDKRIKTTTQVERLNRTTKKGWKPSKSIGEITFEINGHPYYPFSPFLTPGTRSINRYEEGSLRRRDPRVVTREDRSRALTDWALRHPAFGNKGYFSPAIVKVPDEDDKFDVLREDWFWKDHRHVPANCYYRVSTSGAGSCTCPDYQKGNQCKHIISAKSFQRRCFVYPKDCYEEAHDTTTPHGPRWSSAVRRSGRNKAATQMGLPLRRRVAGVQRTFAKKSGESRDATLNRLGGEEPPGIVIGFEPRMTTGDWRRLLQWRVPRKLQRQYRITANDLKQTASDRHVPRSVMRAVVDYLVHPHHTHTEWTIRAPPDLSQSSVVTRLIQTHGKHRWMVYVCDDASMKLYDPLCKDHNDHPSPHELQHPVACDQLRIEDNIPITCSPENTGLFTIGILRSLFWDEGFYFSSREVAYQRRRLVLELLNWYAD